MADKKPRLGVIGHHMPGHIAAGMLLGTGIIKRDPEPQGVPEKNLSPHRSERLVGTSPLLAMDFGKTEERIHAFIAAEAEGLGFELYKPAIPVWPTGYQPYWNGGEARIWSLWHQRKIDWRERNRRLKALEGRYRK